MFFSYQISRRAFSDIFSFGNHKESSRNVTVRNLIRRLLDSDLLVALEHTWWSTYHNFSFCPVSFTGITDTFLERSEAFAGDRLINFWPTSITNIASNLHHRFNIRHTNNNRFNRSKWSNILWVKISNWEHFILRIWSTSDE